jgi:hypothetical protein
MWYWSAWRRGCTWESYTTRLPPTCALGNPSLNGCARLEKSSNIRLKQFTIASLSSMHTTQRLTSSSCRRKVT